MLLLSDERARSGGQHLSAERPVAYADAAAARYRGHLDKVAAALRATTRRTLRSLAVVSATGPTSGL